METKLHFSENSKPCGGRDKYIYIFCSTFCFLLLFQNFRNVQIVGTSNLYIWELILTIKELQYLCLCLEIHMTKKTKFYEMDNVWGG